MNWYKSSVTGVLLYVRDPAVNQSVIYPILYEFCILEFTPRQGSPKTFYQALLAGAARRKTAHTNVPHKQHYPR